MSPQYSYLSGSMTQGGKEMITGQWRGVLGRLDVRDLVNAIGYFLNYSGNLVRKSLIIPQ